METLEHIPVLLREAIDGLDIKPNGVYVDCTLGGAGHASVILKALEAEGHLYCFDQDDYAINRGNLVLSDIALNFTIIKANFKDLKNELAKLGVSEVDGILYDLGVSSFQLDLSDRGFSFHKEAPLDMRMDRSQTVTAKQLVNEASYEELKNILYRYGEERFAPAIAKKIVTARAKKPIETTLELVEVIKSALPARVLRKNGHPARQTFQALRIAVNDELNVFEISLKDALQLLKPEGRIVVITFHSLEDRICKTVFREATSDPTPKGVPLRSDEIKIDYELVNSRVIKPSKAELAANSRASSAKMRIIKKK